MKRLLPVVLVGCVLVGCGKKDVNNLPAECQTTLETWDVYIDMLASDSNVSTDYVDGNRKAKEIDIESIFRQKNINEQILYCKTRNEILNGYMRIFKETPQKFY